MFEQWIRQQSKKIKIDVFNRITHHLSNSEIIYVMDQINSGRDIVDVHIEKGLLDKYRIDLFRIREIVTDKWPQEVVG